MPSGKIIFSIEEKQNIVKEAYAVLNNVKATAKSYKIQPNQIRAWKKNLMEITNVPEKSRKSSETRIENPEIYSSLLEFFHHIRERDVAVSVSMLFREARRLMHFVPFFSSH